MAPTLPAAIPYYIGRSATVAFPIPYYIERSASPAFPFTYPHIVIGIIDCNNFFVSCERVFCPRLRGVPVVVLSNNDGCAIARSNEAKAMGIEMGTPFFRLRALVEAGRLHVRSGNLTLYGDMSRRVMSVVRRSVPRIEVYSIDECFMDLDGIPDVAAFGRELAARVEQWTGIPVSVGVASTKTLAKVASKFAKKYPGYHHCCVIDTEEKRERALRLMPVADVWGVGRRMRDSLHRMGVRTAYDYAALSPERVRRLFALPAVHTLLELRGHKCIPLELPAAKRSITSSRSFKTPIYDFETLRAVVVDFASMCAAKLRREGSAARCVTTYIRTDRFRPDLPQYAQAAAVQLDVASSDLRELSAAAAQALQAIFRTGYGYKKAAVMLTRIEHGSVQGSLFDTVDRRRQSRLLHAVDAIHRRLGPDALRVASQQSHASVMNHEHRSPNYTTSLADIIEVK